MKRTKSTYKFIFLCNSWKLEGSNKKSLSILDANEHCEFSRRLSGKAKVHDVENLFEAARHPGGRREQREGRKKSSIKWGKIVMQI